MELFSAYFPLHFCVCITAHFAFVTLFGLCLFFAYFDSIDDSGTTYSITSPCFSSPCVQLQVVFVFVLLILRSLYLLSFCNCICFVFVYANFNHNRTDWAGALYSAHFNIYIFYTCNCIFISRVCVYIGISISSIFLFLLI